MEHFIKLIEHNLQYEDASKLANNMYFIQDVLNLIFSYISKTDNLDDAILAFKTLEDMQFVLARAVFKEGVIVTNQLNKFISDFDRIYDQATLHYLYLKIKSNKYF